MTAGSQKHAAARQCWEGDGKGICGAPLPPSLRHTHPSQSVHGTLFAWCVQLRGTVACQWYRWLQLVAAQHRNMWVAANANAKCRAACRGVTASVGLGDGLVKVVKLRLPAVG